MHQSIARRNEIVHEMDVFTTLAGMVGGKVPTDRAIDGVDQSAFILGKQEKSSAMALSSTSATRSTV